MFPVVGAPTSARNNATVVPAAPRCFTSRVVSRSDKGISWPLQFGIDQMNKYWPQAGCADASRPASSASHAMYATPAFMTSPAATQSPFDLPASPGPSRASAQRPKTRDDELCQGSDGQETVSDNAQSTEPTVDITTDGGRRRRRRRREGVAALWHKWNPALTLENSGSVARDHLAVERTFLAYVRTSLAIASTGVALVQLFTIASTSNERLQKYTRPLGATIIIIGLCTLVIGVVRYFTIQSLLLKGLYPAARMVAVAIALALCAIIIAVFGILVGNR